MLTALAIPALPPTDAELSPAFNHNVCQAPPLRISAQNNFLRNHETKSRGVPLRGTGGREEVEVGEGEVGGRGSGVTDWRISTRLDARASLRWDW